MKYCAAFFLLAGIACLSLFSLIGSTVLPDGFLQEPFALLPLGWMFIALGVFTLVVSLIRRARRKHVSRAKE